MGMGCSDYTERLHDLLGELGLIEPGQLPDDDPEGQFEVVAPLVYRLALQSARLVALVRQATAPGGIGEHEFVRPGGWRDRVEKVLSDGPVNDDLAIRIVAPPRREVLLPMLDSP